MRKSVKPPAELKKKVFSKRQLQSHNFQTGIKAEKLVATFLINKGYLILEKNLRLGNAEIDLVALDQKFDELVFVEVKYRQSNRYGDASLAVNQLKLNKMQVVARSYLKKEKFKKSHRFDIISVVGKWPSPHITHFENVTWL